jgi:two-component system phosphate regulon response regulator PhoB
LKVLVVDDEEIFLHTTQLILSRTGYQVFTRNNAQNIYDAVDECSPDIIVMDHQMPGVSGVTATKQLKASERHKAIPVIYFSSSDQVAELAAEANADAHLHKSKEFKQLVPLIERIMHARVA